MRCSTKRASSSFADEAAPASRTRASSAAARDASTNASRYAQSASATSCPAHASSIPTCAAGFKSCCWSCWPHKSMEGDTVPASSRTLAMRPSSVTRERPSAPTRRTATSSSSSSRGSSPSEDARESPKKRPLTSKPSWPSRTESLSAREPISSLSADSNAVLPAPVSPVSTVRPCAGTREACFISARFLTCISSIMAVPSACGSCGRNTYGCSIWHSIPALPRNKRARGGFSGYPT